MDLLLSLCVSLSLGARDDWSSSVQFEDSAGSQQPVGL